MARVEDEMKMSQVAEELSERYHSLMEELRNVLLRLGELAELRRALEEAGTAVPDDIREALRKVEARLAAR